MIVRLLICTVLFLAPMVAFAQEETQKPLTPVTEEAAQQPEEQPQTDEEPKDATDETDSGDTTDTAEVAPETTDAPVTSSEPLPQGPAKLVFETLSHDFGDVAQTDRVAVAFKLKNGGGEVLEIGKIDTSCGCTIAQGSKTSYGPGEAGELNVNFDPSRFVGKVVKRITVNSNDATTPQQKLEIHANVLAEIVAAPMGLRFKNAKADDATVQEITVTSDSPMGLELSELKAFPEWLVVEQEKVDKQNARLKVSLDGSKFPLGKRQLRGYVSYNTNSQAQPQMRHQVSVDVILPLTALPQFVLFWGAPAGQTTTKVVEVGSSSGMPFKLTEMTSDLDFVEVALDKDEGNYKFVNVTIKADAPKGNFNGRLTLKSDQAEQPLIELPLRGSVN